MDRTSFAKQLLILAFSITLLSAPAFVSAQTPSDAELAGIFSSLYSVLESLTKALQALGPSPVQAQVTGGQWTQLTPATSAGSIDGPAFVYDIESQQVVMFGNHYVTYTNDTRAFNVNTNNWQLLASTNPPSPRAHMAAVYDELSDRMIIFGGQLASGAGSNDTWLYNFNTNTWTNPNPANPPAANFGIAAAYDRESDRMIMYNGNITWAYDDITNTWENRNLTMSASCLASRPGSMWFTVMAYDSTNDRVIMSGQPTPSPTWSYDYNSNCWQNRNAANQPTFGQIPYMTYDIQSQLIVVKDDNYGSGATALDATYTYNYQTNTWTNQNPSPFPTVHHHGMVYIPSQDRIVLHGGGSQRNQTWEYTLGGAPPPDTIPPSVPTGLSVTAISSSQINLSWTASTDNVGVTGYRVFRGGVQIATPTGTSYADTGLSPSTAYSYTVAAYDAAGNVSAQSSAATATTPAAADTTPPSVPTNLAATAVSSSEINLSWTASTDNVGVTGYRVYRGGTQIATPTGTSYSDASLSPSTTYSYTAAAVDAAGNVSLQSTSASATTQAAGACPTLRCFYIDQNNPLASDSNPGTESLPWITLHRAVDGVPSREQGGVAGTFTPVQAGDTVYVKNGTYVDIQPSSVFDTYLLTNSGTAGAPIAIRAYTPSSGARHAPILDRLNDRPADGGNNHVISASGSYTIWDGFILTDGTTVSINGTGHILENLTVNFGGRPCLQGNPASISVFRGSTHTIRNNRIRGPYYTSSGSLCTTQNATAIFLIGSSNITIANNEISDTSVGIHIKRTTHDAIFENNYIHDLIGGSGSSWGMNLGAAADGVCGTGEPCRTANITARSNIIQNAAFGIETLTSPDAPTYNQYLYNNTFYNVETGIGIRAWGTGSSAAMVNLQGYNNIVHINAVNSNTAQWSSSYTPPTDLLSNYSNFISVGLPVPYGQARFRIGLSVFETLAQWQARGFDLNSISVDPQFVGPLTTPSGFRPQNTQVLSGGRVGGVSSGAAVSIGAYTYGNEVIGIPPSGSPTPPPPPPPIDTTAPSIPAGLTATAISSSQINLTWNASTDNVGVTGYRVYRGGVQIASVTSGISYSDTGLSPSTTYSYTVAAYDAAGNVSAQSSAASATTQPTTSTRFNLNDRVQTTASLNVRATPSTSGILLGTQPTGSLGTVIGGPTVANGFNWWNINYDNAPDGWSVEDFLVLAPVTPPPPPPPPPSPTPVTNVTFTPYLEGTTYLATRSFTIVLLTPGTTNQVAQFTATADTSGNLSLPSTVSISSDTYDLLVDSAYYLRRRAANVTFSSNTTIPLPILRAGDLNDDNAINSLDWSLMSPRWFTNDPTSDLNRDGLVNSIDYSFMNSHWAEAGD